MKHKIFNLALVMLGAFSLTACSLQDIINGLPFPSQPGQTEDNNNNTSKPDFGGDDNKEKINVGYYVDHRLYQSYQIDRNTVPPRPKDPVKEGYTFDCWTLYGDPYDFRKLLDQDTALHARFVTSGCTVLLEPNGGRLPYNSVNLQAGHYFTVPVPTNKENFIGYFEKGRPVTDDKGVSLKKFESTAYQTVFEARYGLDMDHMIHKPLSIKVAQPRLISERDAYKIAEQRLIKDEPNIVVDFIADGRETDLTLPNIDGEPFKANIIKGYDNQLNDIYQKTDFINLEKYDIYTINPAEYEPNILNLQSVLPTDGTYFMPYHTTASTLVLNMELLEKVTLPSYQVINGSIFKNMSINEFFNNFILELYNFENEHKLLNPASKCSIIGADFDVDLIAGLYDNLGSFAHMDQDGNLSVDFVNETAVKLLSSLREWHNIGLINTRKTNNNGYLSDNFINGSCYMMFVNSSNLRYPGKAQFKMDIAVPPIGLSHNNSRMLAGIKTNDEQTDIATALFMKHLSCSEVDAILATSNLGHLVNRTATYNTSMYTNYLNNIPSNSNDLNAIFQRAYHRNLDNVTSFKLYPMSYEVRRTLVDRANEYMINTDLTDDELLNLLRSDKKTLEEQFKVKFKNGGNL